MVDHGDDTNSSIRSSQDSTTRWLANIATGSKGSPYLSGRSSQSYRGEQKVAEKGELGDHDGYDRAVNHR